MRASRPADPCRRCSGIRRPRRRPAKFALEDFGLHDLPGDDADRHQQFAGRPRASTTAFPTAPIAAIVAAGYTAMQLNDRLWLGFSLNSPFGLSVGFQNPNWAGAFYGESSTLKTYNASPSVAYKIADWMSVGVGFQAQYAQVNLKDRRRVYGSADSGHRQSRAAHRRRLGLRVDRGRDRDADPVDANRPRLSLGHRSKHRRKLHHERSGRPCYTGPSRNDRQAARQREPWRAPARHPIS